MKTLLIEWNNCCSEEHGVFLETVESDKALKERMAELDEKSTNDGETSFRYVLFESESSIKIVNPVDGLEKEDRPYCVEEEDEDGEGEEDSEG